MFFDGWPHHSQPGLVDQQEGPVMLQEGVFVTLGKDEALRHLPLDFLALLLLLLLLLFSHSGYVGI
jgi:hypothetical protein